MFPITKALTENTELLDLAVKGRQRLSRLKYRYGKNILPLIVLACAPANFCGFLLTAAKRTCLFFHEFCHHALYLYV